MKINSPEKEHVRNTKKYNLQYTCREYDEEKSKLLFIIPRFPKMNHRLLTTD